MPSANFPSLSFDFLSEVEIPDVCRLRLNHSRGTPVADVTSAARRAVESSDRIRALASGSSVAVALGSRGISRIVEVAQAIIAALKDMGHDPFVVPAMGSHGGGTAAGQLEVLNKLGLSEESLGVSIRSSMDVVDYGTTKDGASCKFDRNAAYADAVIVVNRVKSHTTFEREIESGLVKMVAVGLGKAEGARSVHRTGPPAFNETLPALAAIALEHSSIALGIALVENTQKELVAVEGVAPEAFFDSDKTLLKLAKSFIARLPFGKMDALLVEQIGKDISGAGMDYAVMGRADLRTLPNPPEPFATRIAVLGLSKATGGNGLGIGLADFTTVSVVDTIDLQQIYMNSLTSTMAEKSRIPIVLKSDLDAVRASVSSSWSANDLATRLCLIKSTLHLHEILVSRALLDDALAGGTAEQISGFFPLRFSAEQQLLTRAYADEDQRECS